MIAIAGGKGGCGKTTTAFGLAAAVGTRHEPARVVDLDREMPDLHTLAGVDREPTLAAVDPRTTDTAHRTTERIAQPASEAPGVEIVAAPRPSDRIDLDVALGTVAGSGPLFCDCPCGAGPDAAAPLGIVDSVALVSTATEASLRDAAKTAAMARALGTPADVAIVTGVERVPAGVSELLGVTQVYAVPESDRPLSDRRTTAAYRRAAEALLRV